MRTIERTAAFKREKLGPYKALDRSLAELLQSLAADAVLPARARDHPLAGKWSGFRECHVRPDLLLIYQKPVGVLRLVRLGSHSELFAK